MNMERGTSLESLLQNSRVPNRFASGSTHQTHSSTRGKQTDEHGSNDESLEQAHPNYIAIAMGKCDIGAPSCVHLSLWRFWTTSTTAKDHYPAVRVHAGSHYSCHASRRRSLADLSSCRRKTCPDCTYYLQSHAIDCLPHQPASSIVVRKNTCSKISKYRACVKIEAWWETTSDLHDETSIHKTLLLFWML